MPTDPTTRVAEPGERLVFRAQECPGNAERDLKQTNRQTDKNNSEKIIS